MLRISRQTDYGMILMTGLSRSPGAFRSATELAEAHALPLPMASKVLKLLARAGLLESQRGAAGGYRLARPAGDISVADVIAVLDGPIALTECVAVDGDCDHADGCPTRGHWHVINAALGEALGRVTLDDMRRPSTLLEPVVLHMDGRP